MSYATIDHAAWVAEHNRRIVANWNRRKHTKPRDIPLPPTKLNAFQKKVCDILGMAGAGAEHSPVNWDRAIWEWGDGQTAFACVWSGEISTWDFSSLTLLVFLCHEARIRLAINGIPNGEGYNRVRLEFYERLDVPDAKMGHPDLAQAVRWFKDVYLPKDHRIIYAGVKK